MPSGERNRTESSGLDYGAAVGSENVDFAQDSHTESPGTRDRALLDRLKDALKPGDARRRRRASAAEARRPSGDSTHDGRHGGIVEVMEPSNRDYYDEREEVPRGGLLDELGQRTPARENGRRRSSILDSVQFGGHGQSRGEESKETKSGGGGIMDAVRRKSESGRSDKYRDSSHIKKSDEHHFPGGMYRSIRDDFSK
ncbi:hypothetical protein FHL15_009841 [Xylaria flabelliformis]|uniref:Uncharacterized protein n=1 Tax=Xylaria flabelliformis TaxID=2512241 RepID=A0A553HMT4_9PEZI|nr:hypothetical protein FHL15_009841 [Xylaria flabelliformis]